MSDALTIRRATAADAPTLLGLVEALAQYEKLTPPDEPAQQRLVRDVFERRRLDAWIAQIGAEAAGYALTFESYSSFLALPKLYLEDLFVLPQYRGCGAGYALFQEIVAEAKRRGCAKVEWTVLEWNEPAKDFYRRSGAHARADWGLWQLPL